MNVQNGHRSDKLIFRVWSPTSAPKLKTLPKSPVIMLAVLNLDKTKNYARFAKLRQKLY